MLCSSPVGVPPAAVGGPAGGHTPGGNSVHDDGLLFYPTPLCRPASPRGCRQYRSVTHALPLPQISPRPSASRRGRRGVTTAAGDFTATQRIGLDHALQPAVAPTAPGCRKPDAVCWGKGGALAEPLAGKVRLFPGMCLHDASSRRPIIKIAVKYTLLMNQFAEKKHRENIDYGMVLCYSCLVYQGKQEYNNVYFFVESATLQQSGFFIIYLPSISCKTP